MKPNRKSTPRPRAWSEDLEPVGPTHADRAWDALGSVRLGMAANAYRALFLRGRDAAMIFADRRTEGLATPDPVWPIEEGLGWLMVPAKRTSSPIGFLDVAGAARRFNLTPDHVRRIWMLRWGDLWDCCLATTEAGVGGVSDDAV